MDELRAARYWGGNAAALDPEALSQALGNIFRRSAVTHGGILFESPDGQHKIGIQAHNLTSEIIAACDRLIDKNKHPGLVLGKKTQTPFNLFKYEDDLAADPDIGAFFDALRQANFQSVFYLPIRDLSGNLYISAAASQNRTLNPIEARLIHSFCLDAATKLQSATIEDADAKDLLTPRERQCLVAAAKGLTEKQTAKQFDISPNTVHAHLENCKRKLGARNKLSAIIKGLRLGEILPREIDAD